MTNNYTTESPLGVNNGPDNAETGLPKCPRERTFAVLVDMSQTCHNQTSHSYSITGARQDRLRNFRCHLQSSVSPLPVPYGDNGFAHCKSWAAHSCDLNSRS